MRNNKTVALVSRCLLGVPCRYHGRACAEHGRIRALRAAGHTVLVPVCPEVEGGLPTPRPPSRRAANGHLYADGLDVTGAFACGAELAVQRAHECGATKAYLVRGSPACDRDRGVAARALAAAGLKIIAV